MIVLFATFLYSKPSTPKVEYIPLTSTKAGDDSSASSTSSGGRET